MIQPVYQPAAERRRHFPLYIWIPGVLAAMATITIILILIQEVAAALEPGGLSL